MKEKIFRIFFLAFLALALSIPLLSIEKGVVVEDVKKYSSGEKAGIQAGDIFQSWERPSSPPSNPEKAKGSLASVFDFMIVEIEQGPRGPVKLSGVRGAKRIVLEIPVGEWKISVRPAMGEPDLKRYLEGKALIEAKETEKGIGLWEQLVRSEKAARDDLFSCWLHLQIGNTWADQRKWKEARAAYQEALSQTEKNKDPRAQAAVWNGIARSFQRQNDLKKSQETYEKVIQIWEGKKERDLNLALSLHNAGTMAYFLGNLDKAEAYHKRALEIRKKLAPESVETAMSLNNLGLVINRRGDVQKAEMFYLQALEIWEKVAPVSLPAALTLNNLSIVAYQEGNLAKAIDYGKRTLAIRETIAPNSLDVAASLNNLGVFTEKQGNLEEAETLFKRSLAIKEKLAPGSLDVAYSLTNLATIAEARGDLVGAEVLHKQALAIREKIAPNSLEMTSSLNNLGVIAGHRGYLELSESYHKRALAIREKLAPQSFETASSLTNWGNVAHRRGDLEIAESFYKRALAIFEKLIPDSFHMAGLLGNLGNITRDKGDLDTAEAYLERSLALREKLVPGSYDLAESLDNLGVIAHDRGDLDRAEAFHKRALSIREKLAAEGIEVAASLNNLGTVARDRGDLEKAESYFLNALSIWKKSMPGTISEAETFHELGLIYRKSNQLQKAGDFLLLAISSLETQISRLGGSQETKVGFQAKYGRYYQDYLDVLMRLKKQEEAFHLLERSRAQLFLAMLAERDIIFSADLPEVLEKARKRNAWEYDQTQRKMGQLDPAKNREEIEKLSTKILELQGEQASIAEQVRKASPRFASLQYPEPLDTTGVKNVLDGGTTLLSYSIGKEEGFLFVITKEEGLKAYPLSLSEENLRKDVERFRSLIQKGRLDPSVPESLLAQGKRLYDLLVKPAESLIKKSQRILIVPDGPLYVLPFGALIRSSRASFRASPRNWQYLVEWKPIHIAVSATVYGEIKKQRKEPEEQQEKILWAFGDPSYPPLEGDKAKEFNDAVVRSLAVRGYGFSPLPASRQEVLTIAQSFGQKAGIFLGDEATEEKAKTTSKDVNYLHFACHGLIDEKFPLNSGIALSIPTELREGQDNGLLQAWEIFERIRLDADLLVLSACETGLGKEMAGEGLVGLTRAFQYAGSQSVVASLWEVADLTTAELMKRFYEYMRMGGSKDKSLQAAQLDFINKPIAIKKETGETEKWDTSHPFFWAAFTLQGDWK